MCKFQKGRIGQCGITSSPSTSSFTTYSMMGSTLSKFFINTSHSCSEEQSGGTIMLTLSFSTGVFSLISRTGQCSSGASWSVRVMSLSGIVIQGFSYAFSFSTISNSSPRHRRTSFVCPYETLTYKVVAKQR